MKSDMDKIIASKASFRTKMANLPIGDKLRLLDKMREREISIRNSRTIISEST